MRRGHVMVETLEDDTQARVALRHYGGDELQYG